MVPYGLLETLQLARLAFIRHEARKNYIDCFLYFSVIEAFLNNYNVMILLCTLAIKPEARKSFPPTLNNEITTRLLSFSVIPFLTENLTFWAQISSSGPLFLHRGHDTNTSHLKNILTISKAIPHLIGNFCNGIIKVLKDK